MQRKQSCNETRIFQYDPEKTGSQWAGKHFHLPWRKLEMGKSQVKAMLTVFFDINSVITQKWVPDGATLLQIGSWNLAKKGLKKESTAVERWFLHLSSGQRQSVAQKHTTVPDHHPYSPNRGLSFWDNQHTMLTHMTEISKMWWSKKKKRPKSLDGLTAYCTLISEMQTIQVTVDPPLSHTQRFV